MRFNRRLYEEDGCWIFYGKRVTNEWYFYVSIEYADKLYFTTWYDWDEVPHGVTKGELITHLLMVTIDSITSN